MSTNNQTEIITKNESTLTLNTNVGDKLPTIDAKGQAYARSKAASWAMQFWDLPIGYIHEDDAGVNFQVINRGTVRCLSVWDDTYYYETLALMILSFQEAGISVEIDPYTMILQLPERAVWAPTSRGI